MAQLINTMAEAKKEKAVKLFAVVRLRGEVGVNKKIAITLELLRLHKKHRCVLIPANKNNMGMISKVKDYCTFGEVDEEVIRELLQKRGRIAGDQQLTAEFLKKNKLTFETFAKKLMNMEIRIKEIDGLKPFFKLHPPRGGFEREGIKKPFTMHGSLGYRRADINKLLRKMI